MQGQDRDRAWLRDCCCSALRSAIWASRTGLGHFQISGQAALAETGHAERLGLISRGARSPSPVDHLPAEDRALVEPCLELQADHDAMEVVLGPYSNQGWLDLRRRVVAIFAMMVLIEREDERSGFDHRSHPKAATRIFQLLGHLTEMWSLSAHADATDADDDAPRVEDLPPKAEIEAFAAQVIVPAFGDTVILAGAGGAEKSLADLGDPTDFFADIAMAQSGAWESPSEFRTSGGQEWARLYQINRRILDALGHR